MISCNNNPKSSQEILPAKVEKTEQPDTVAAVEFIEPEELPIEFVKKHTLTEQDLYTDYDGGNQLADYFQIELIDYETFLNNKSMAVNFLSIDSVEMKKKDGILRLPYAKGEINFIDNPIEGDNFKEYTYIGQIDELNVYLISGIYWEDWNYFFVDKKTGRTVQTFLNMPYLSADRKHVLSLDFDNIEGTTMIDLYEVTNQKQIDPLIGMYVKKWVPVNTSDSMYWANDNYLYLPVIHNNDYWAADGNSNDYSNLAQYIRLKPIV